MIELKELSGTLNVEDINAINNYLTDAPYNRKSFYNNTGPGVSSAAERAKIRQESIIKPIYGIDKKAADAKAADKKNVDKKPAEKSGSSDNKEENNKLLDQKLKEHDATKTKNTL